MATKQMQVGDKEEYRVVLKVQQYVNGELNLTVYDSLIGVHDTIQGGVEQAKRLRQNATS